MLNRLLTAVIALSLLFAVACTQQRANTPSVKDQVNKALDSANLKDVKVDEDRDKGVVKLSGDVKTPEDKQRAEDIARQNAPNMVVSNEIGVRPEGAEGTAKDIDNNLDSGIEKNYKAALTENRLDNQHIRVDVKNGVVTLKGDVDNMQQRQQAEKLAANIPNVQQVVNELEVKGAKHHKAPAGK
jgi:hyperosmotically inducible periplasmic protein